MEVMNELEDLVSIRKGLNESDIEYLTRLVETVDSYLGDNEYKFKKLSENTQIWLNNAIISYNKSLKEKTPIVFPSIPAIPSEVVEVLSQDLKVEIGPTPTEPVTENLTKKKPVTTLIREVICKNRLLSLPEIKEIISKQNIACKSSTVDLVYSDTRATLKVLESLGMLKES